VTSTARGPHWYGCLGNTHPSRTTGPQRLRATVTIIGSRHVLHQKPRRAANPRPASLRSCGMTDDALP
jgi:hypothetical protein